MSLLGTSFGIQRKRKIIAISGGGVIEKQNILDSATRIGAHRGLEKPFTAEKLLETVADLQKEIHSESK